MEDYPAGSPSPSTMARRIPWSQRDVVAVPSSPPSARVWTMGKPALHCQVDSPQSHPPMPMNWQSDYCDAPDPPPKDGVPSPTTILPQTFFLSPKDEEAAPKPISKANAPPPGSFHLSAPPSKNGESLWALHDMQYYGFFASW